MMRPLINPISHQTRRSISRDTTWENQRRGLQLELGTPTTIGLGSVEHVDPVLKSDLDDIFGGISINLATDGEP